eukprot:2489665-Karenia_brevis.AAC.1
MPTALALEGCLPLRTEQKREVFRRAATKMEGVALRAAKAHLTGPGPIETPLDENSTMRADELAAIESSAQELQDQMEELRRATQFGNAVRKPSARMIRRRLR